MTDGAKNWFIPNKAFKLRLVIAQPKKKNKKKGGGGGD